MTTANTPATTRTIVVESMKSLFLKATSLFRSPVCARRKTLRGRIGKTPIPDDCGPANKASFLRRGHIKMAAHLLGMRAATLDQDNQNDDNQHTGNNPDDRGSVHDNSSFPH